MVRNSSIPRYQLIFDSCNSKKTKRCFEHYVIINPNCWLLMVFGQGGFLWIFICFFLSFTDTRLSTKTLKSIGQYTLLESTSSPNSSNRAIPSTKAPSKPEQCSTFHLTLILFFSSSYSFSLFSWLLCDSEIMFKTSNDYCKKKQDWNDLYRDIL